MIEIVSAENGEKVLRYQGRLLASRFDPRKEARDWLASRGRFLDKVRSVFVLGLGSGHHIAELLETTSARIIVLEASEEIIHSGIANFDSSRVSIHHVATARSLRKIDAVKAAIRESFVVVTHAPSASLFPELYKECRAQLVGRDWGNLGWQWKMRNAPGFDKIPKIHMGEQPLTVHDLEQTELVQNSEEREKLLFKALRELVK